MTVCPIAVVAGCKKCPVFAICPAKGIIGDYVREEKKAEPEQPTAKNTKAKK